jgi:hypothetical protein
MNTFHVKFEIKSLTLSWMNYKYYIIKKIVKIFQKSNCFYEFNELWLKFLLPY